MRWKNIVIATSSFLRVTWLYFCFCLFVLFILQANETCITVNPLYTDTRYNDKIIYNDNLNITNHSLKRWPDSNKYPKHMYYEKIRINHGLSYISCCPLRILYNSKFIIMATFLRTNAVVVTRVHYLCWSVSTRVFCRCFISLYRIYPKYSDIHARANGVDRDLTLQSSASDHVWEAFWGLLTRLIGRH